MGEIESNIGDPIDSQAQYIIEKMQVAGVEPLDPELVKGFVKDVMDVLGVEVEAVVPDARFKEDLEADSLDLVEFVMAQEERSDITIPEEELGELKTVAQALALIAGKLIVRDDPDDGTSGDREPRNPVPVVPSSSTQEELPSNPLV